MESTLFTTLTANEEANLSGGNLWYKKPVKTTTSTTTTTTTTIKLTGGNGGAGGAGGAGGPGILNSGSGKVSVTGGTVKGGAG
ncbi:MAG: hypothetical protein ACYTX0_41660, partial [Nostoc sp.]